MSTPYRDRNSEACVFKGFCCVYTAFTTECGWRAHSECLYLRTRGNWECCFDDYQTLTVGVDCAPPEPGSVCKIGLGICEYEWMEQPRVLCGSAGHNLCLRVAGSLPMHNDFLDRLVFAYYCLQCLPDIACCATPPDCPVLNQMKANYISPADQERMERGDYDMVKAPTAHVLSVEDDPNEDLVFALDGEDYKDMPISSSANKIV
jgi:hypothetical protein